MNRLIPLLWFCSTGFALAHGIDALPIEGGRGVAVRYADGSPASFAEVKVRAPEGGAVFQEGLTDREGRFVFFPATSGVWRVAVDDGMGHAVEVDLPFQVAAASEASPARTRATKSTALVTGIAVIWALFSSYGWWRARRA